MTESFGMHLLLSNSASPVGTPPNSAVPVAPEVTNQHPPPPELKFVQNNGPPQVKRRRISTAEEGLIIRMTICCR